jgi:hypothetical protein
MTALTHETKCIGHCHHVTSPGTHAETIANFCVDPADIVISYACITGIIMSPAAHAVYLYNQYKLRLVHNSFRCNHSTKPDEPHGSFRLHQLVNRSIN